MQHPSRKTRSVEAALKWADPRVFNLRYANRMALSTAMPHLREHIDEYINRRHHARLASPAAVHEARASLVDPRNMIPTTAELYREIVNSVREKGVLAARQTRNPRNQGRFFHQEVVAFIRSFPRRELGGIEWTQRYTGNSTWAIFPNDGHQGGRRHNLYLPRGMDTRLVHHMTLSNERLWSIRIDIKHDAVTLSVHIGGDPVLQPDNTRWLQEYEVPDPYWDAIVTTRIAFDGSVTLRHARVSACGILREHPNRKVTSESCMKRAFAGVRLFGSGYNIELMNSSWGHMSYNMQGLRNAMMQ